MIVRGFDAVTDGKFPHLVTEHLEGPTLRELIDRDGALPPEQALPLGLHAASALHYLAGEGMVHLDVKPENIVMGAPPRLITARSSRPRTGETRPIADSVVAQSPPVASTRPAATSTLAAW